MDGETWPTAGTPDPLGMSGGRRGAASSARVLPPQIHDLRCDSAGADAQQSDTGREAEAARTGGSRVHDEAALGFHNERTVRVTVYEHRLRVSRE